MADSVVDIALIYPELLGTYGDGGNALVLARRLERRGIANRVLEIGIDDPVPRSAAIYLLGGGEDAPQFTALDALRTSGALTAGVDAGAVLLAVCAGYQLVGATLTGPEGTSIDGLGLLDAATTRARHASSARSPCATTSSARAGSSASRTTAASRRPEPVRSRSARAHPSAGSPPTAPCTDGSSAPTCTARCSRGIPASPIACSSGWSGRSTRSTTRKPSCCTKSGAPRSSAHARGGGGTKVTANAPVATAMIEKLAGTEPKR